MDDRKEWMKAEVKKLIQMFYDKPELWDPTDNHYRNRARKQKVLTEMAKVFSTTVYHVQKKLHNLRNQLNRECKKRKTRDSDQENDEQYATKWPYYDLLTFLLPDGAGKPIADLQLDATLEETADGNTKSSDDGLSCEQSEELIVPDITHPVRRKKRKIMVPKKDLLLQKAIHTLSKDEDQYDVFGKYVACEMRSLSTDSLRRKMKRKFQQIIQEINEEDDQLSYAASQSCLTTRGNSVRGYSHSSNNQEQSMNLPPTQTSVSQDIVKVEDESYIIP